MIAQQTLIPSFVQHLRSRMAPFKVRLRGEPTWEDSAEHAASYRADPELYALLALTDKARPAQRARVLFRLLAESRVGLGNEVRRTLERVTAWLLDHLPADEVLSVFLALRRARANHKHARRAVVGYVLNHPAAAALALRRRPALRDALEHALGRNVARACGKFLAKPELTDLTAAESAYLRRNLLRFASPGNEERARLVVGSLYHRSPADAVGLAGVAALAPAGADAAPADEAARPATVTATNRGDIAATLVHLYRGGESADLRQALARYVDEAAARLPRLDGTVALVLDASASTRGYGEREFACVSQSQALRLVLDRCCAGLRVFTVGRGGGAGELPQPEGVTSLADPLLDALESGADVVAVVSDGYENVFAGDLARVVASLPAAGVATPVVFCHSKFTDKDDLALRRPAPALPEVEFWHQADFADVLWAIFSRAGNGRGDGFVRQDLRRRLEEWEGAAAAV